LSALGLADESYGNNFRQLRWSTEVTAFQLIYIS
jgi:hypothetical protein